MAWAEILAAADEAIAAVATGTASGTAGDSGVFIPESLLRTGAAATQSMTRGRLADANPRPDAARSHSDTGVLPRSVLLRADAAAASSTLQLADADLSDLRDPAGESAADLPTPGARPPAPVPPLAAPTATNLDPTPDDLHTSVTDVAAASHGSTDSAASLRAVIDRSAAWPVAARSQQGRSPSRPLAWAAALLVMIGGVAAGVRYLRPADSARTTTSPLAAASPAPRPVATALPAAIARPRDLSSGTGHSFSPLARALPSDLSDETATAPTGERDAQWSQPASEAAAPPAIAATLPPAAALPVPIPASTPAAPPAVASATPTRPTPSVTPPAATVAPRSRPAAANLPETSPLPSGPRKSSPGARLPDAGHELAAPIDHDPLRAATLLTRAEQAAARGEQGLALSLAIQSYHAQPSNNALLFAGKQACKLGDTDKVRWTRQHLPPGELGPVDAACKAAGLALE